MIPSLESVLHGLTAPLGDFADPAKRTFLPYLLVAALLATVGWARRFRGRISLLAFLFPRKLWLHPSARLDYALIFGRAVLGATLLVPFVVSSVYIARSVALACLTRWGSSPFPFVSTATKAAVFTVTAFVAEDFVRYFLHRLFHRIPVLWAFHKVHHSAEVLTPFTEYRTHPFESVVMRAGAAFTVGVVAGLCSWAFGGRVGGWEIFGIDALGCLWNASVANLRHSHVWLSFGPRWERVFSSPAQHQLHHSADPRHFDCNYGVVFSIWDQWGGTYQPGASRPSSMRFGLPPEEDSYEPTLLGAWFGPLVALLPRSRHRLRS